MIIAVQEQGTVGNLQVWRQHHLDHPGNTCLSFLGLLFGRHGVFSVKQQILPVASDSLAGMCLVQWNRHLSFSHRLVDQQRVLQS